MDARRIIASALCSVLTPATLLGTAPQPDRVVIPNSSFEEPGDHAKAPRGWEFSGPESALDAAWTKETPFEGHRAVRIDARHGSHLWQSKSIELPAQREYLLTWQTRFHGEKVWRFRAAFCGVEVVLQNEDGQSLKAVRAHSSCWQTAGWQPAWLRLRVPDKAESLVVRFAVETEDALPGGFDVDSVELLHWPPTSSPAESSCLRLQIRNEMGQPTAARVRAVSRQGKTIRAIGAVRTYVRCGSLRLASIADAYRAGRTFATNGPLIDLKVGEAGPGEEVILADNKQAIRVNVEAVSIGQLDRVEVVVNGRTRRTLTPTESHRIAGTFSLPATESVWIAAKAIGPEDPHLASELEGRKIGAGQFAHTSPVYLLVQKRPILAAHREDAHYFARWCDATLRAWQTHVLDTPSAAKVDQLVRKRLDQAKLVFLELASVL